jgi:hypothetical protein
LTTYPLPKQLARYRDRGPFDASTRQGRLSNAGYAEAGYNLRTMSRIKMSVPMIWVDIEPYPTFPWSHSHRANRAIVTGVIAGYRNAGYRVGI